MFNSTWNFCSGRFFSPSRHHCFSPCREGGFFDESLCTGAMYEERQMMSVEAL